MSVIHKQYVYGRHPVLETIRSGSSINKAWILENSGQSRDKKLSKIEQLLKEQGVVVNYTKRLALDRMVEGANHQGVIIQVAARDYADSWEVLNSLAQRGKHPLVLVLDQLQDGHNLGACLRVADAAAVDLVVIPERRSASLDQFVAKASVGAVEYVPVAREVNLSRFILDLKKAGYWIFGAAGEAQQSYREVDYSGKVCVVIGNEGKGISSKLREHCDFLIKIPMYGKINSLNASVACGIILVEAAYQRQS